MDEVFGKYCAKTPAFKICVKNLTDTVKQCLDDNEKSTLDTVLEVSKKLGEFLCYNDGDRLASKSNMLIRKLLSALLCGTDVANLSSGNECFFLKFHDVKVVTRYVMLLKIINNHL